MERETKTYEVTLRGISPLLMNPMTLEQLMDIHNKVRKPQKTDVNLTEVASGKLYKDEEGRIGIPMQNLYSVLVEAGRNVSFKAKKNISTKDSTLVPIFLTFHDEFFPFTRYASIIDGQLVEGKWTADLRRGINPGSVGVKVPVAVIRPKFKEWEFKCTIDVDEKKVSKEITQQLFEWGGDAVGLCDFRPTCRGPFGRFEVADWKEIQNGNGNGKK
jgi:hypothetical protein